jgi:hypothetical protein
VPVNGMEESRFACSSRTALSWRRHPRPNATFPTKMGSKADSRNRHSHPAPSSFSVVESINIARSKSVRSTAARATVCAPEIRLFDVRSFPIPAFPIRLSHNCWSCASTLAFCSSSRLTSGFPLNRASARSRSGRAADSDDNANRDTDADPE